MLLCWCETELKISASTAYECLDRGSQQDVTLAALPAGLKVSCRIGVGSGTAARVVFVWSGSLKDCRFTSGWRRVQAKRLTVLPPSHNSNWMHFKICLSLGRILSIARKNESSAISTSQSNYPAGAEDLFCWCFWGNAFNDVKSVHINITK